MLPLAVMRVRAHVRLVAAVWLTCQVVAFAAAPFVLCHDHNVMSQMGAGHECDPSHPSSRDAAPASSAHEHHHHHSRGAEPRRRPTTPRSIAVARCPMLRLRR